MACSDTCSLLWVYALWVNEATESLSPQARCRAESSPTTSNKYAQTCVLAALCRSRAFAAGAGGMDDRERAAEKNWALEKDRELLLARAANAKAMAVIAPSPPSAPCSQ